MPPKIKITKEAIIQTTIDLVRQNGTDAINARTIANALHCSTQPIFFNFKTMEDLEKETLKTARSYYFSFLKKEIESGKYSA